MTTMHADLVIVGGGLAGLVSTLEALRSGLKVILVDRDTPERLGGLGLWAFGGMALVGTPLQKRHRIPDTPERALADWLSFAELAEDDVYSRQWAEHYVHRSCPDVYEWLRREGVGFMPAVNWVERGMQGDGNSLPRYHVIWGTARHLLKRMIAQVHAASSGRLQILHQHQVLSLEHQAGQICGVQARRETDQAIVRIQAPIVILAMGGINGSEASVRAHWPNDRPMPSTFLNGAHPYSDGTLHHWVADHLSAQIHNAGSMWNYAAGIPHPQPHFPGHGLSAIPCKSALWLNHRGERIGPQPLVTGFDTHQLCLDVARLEMPYTWQLMNWRIAIKEFAISGAEHNPHIRDRHFFRFLLDTLNGNKRLIRQMLAESPHVLADQTLEGLAQRMNDLTGESHIHADVLNATVNAFDAQFAQGNRLYNDDQIRRILHARQWPADRLRTCKPAPLQKPGSGPWIAMQLQLITRKSLGGLRTDLQSRVLDRDNRAITGLYCVGEAAGFGGGGCSGRRSLEGTFLPGCILTAKAAIRSIVPSSECH